MSEPIPISALQHYAYCPRQCSLIHVEFVWKENIYTLRGKRAHEAVDIPEGMLRDGVRVERALPLWSEQYGLIGVGDVVEFSDHIPYPVEHKVGSKWAKTADQIQLAAQAVCLEEMFGVPVTEGALYYRSSRRRLAVAIDQPLRVLLEQTIEAVRHLVEKSYTPPPLLDARCPNCSLIEACMPEVPLAIRALDREVDA